MRKQIIFFILAGLILMASAAYAAVIHCDLCGKEVSDNYFRSPDGRNYCADCWAKYKLCAICGKLSKSTLTVDDKPVCQECYRKMPRCGLCNKIITGKYVVFSDLNLTVSDNCMKTKPHCDKCGVPSNNLITYGNMHLCQNCSTRGEKCRSCGNPLAADFTFFEGNRDRKYCAACVARYPHCADCGAPSGPYGTQLNDGRYLCPDCRKIALFEPGFITPIKNKVLGLLSSSLNIKVNHRIEYSLQGEDFLKEKSKNSNKDLKGLFYRKDDSLYIYTLYGLREIDFVEVLAHEITHAWQSENCKKPHSKEDSEGFAQWIAFKTLNSFGFSQFAQIMTDGNTVYSGGLRKMLDIEKNFGQDSLYSLMTRR